MIDSGIPGWLALMETVKSRPLVGKLSDNINGPIRCVTIKADASDRWSLSFYWVTEHGFARVSEV